MMVSSVTIAMLSAGLTFDEDRDCASGWSMQWCAAIRGVDDQGDVMASKRPAAKRTAKRSAAKRPAAPRPAPRLDMPSPDALTPAQQKLHDAIAGGPRGTFKFSGPFAIWLHAPELGLLAQALGAHCRYKTSLSPRLSEFAILTTARLWRAQYEWQAHEPQAAKAGVKQKTIGDLRAGREPKSAPADERAVHAFITELYRTRRVSDRTYQRVLDILETTGTVELVGIIGYYALISMNLNVFRAATDPDRPTPFREP
jgi:4-carboxymuconolactone decarboxylase